MRILPISLFLTLVTTALIVGSPSAHAGRNLTNAGICVRNLDFRAAVDKRYFNGSKFIIKRISDIQFVEKKLGELQRDLGNCQKLVNALNPDERSSEQGVKAGQIVQKWTKYDAMVRPAFARDKKRYEENESKCHSFAKEIMQGKVKNSIASLFNTAVSSGNTASLVEIKDHAKTVNAACQRPEYRNVGVDSCASMKRGNDAYRDPSKWCEVAPKWKEILTRRVDAVVQKQINAFKNRPLVQGRLKGDQSMTFFSRTVPNREGWRNTYRIADIVFPDEWKKKYVDTINQQYAEIEVSKKLSIKDFAAIEDAFAELRAGAKSSTYESPGNDGSDYSVRLAKKQVKSFSFKAKVLKAYLGRSSYKIIKNRVPLRRVKPGYVLIQPSGQKLCTMISYTLTEQHQGGGRYLKAKSVSFGYGRFQRCK